MIVVTIVVDDEDDHHRLELATLHSPHAHHAQRNPFTHAALRGDRLLPPADGLSHETSSFASIRVHARERGRGTPAQLSAAQRVPPGRAMRSEARDLPAFRRGDRDRPSSSRCGVREGRGGAASLAPEVAPRPRRDWASTRWEKRSWRACMRGFCVWLVSTRTSLLACSHPRSLLPRPGLTSECCKQEVVRRSRMGQRERKRPGR